MGDFPERERKRAERRAQRKEEEKKKQAAKTVSPASSLVPVHPLMLPRFSAGRDQDRTRDGLYGPRGEESSPRKESTITSCHRGADQGRFRLEWRNSVVVDIRRVLYFSCRALDGMKATSID